MFDSLVIQELLHNLTHELHTVIAQEDLRTPEPKDDVFTEIFWNVFGECLARRPQLYPFTEFVRHYKKSGISIR